MPNLVDQQVSIQACAAAAIQNGFPGFAMQNGFACFGSAQMMQTYTQLGPNSNCHNGDTFHSRQHSVTLTTLGYDFGLTETLMQRRTGRRLGERRVPVHR